VSFGLPVKVRAVQPSLIDRPVSEKLLAPEGKLYTGKCLSQSPFDPDTVRSARGAPLLARIAPTLALTASLVAAAFEFSGTPTLCIPYRGLPPVLIAYRLMVLRALH